MAITTITVSYGEYKPTSEEIEKAYCEVVYDNYFKCPELSECAESVKSELAFILSEIEEYERDKVYDGIVEDYGSFEKFVDEHFSAKRTLLAEKLESMINAWEGRCGYFYDTLREYHQDEIEEVIKRWVE